LGSARLRKIHIMVPETIETPPFAPSVERERDDSTTSYGSRSRHFMVKSHYHESSTACDA
ncbi:MAG TPA: hypothetical protein VGN15_04140, partial [Ktedonobacteraceae bacterium]|nr:hypothetical protein [Ktedonobacteraceae bacterium]